MIPDQAELFLLLVAVTAFFTLRWSLRLAPAASELPLKSAVALALAASASIGPILGYPVVPVLTLIALVYSPLYAFAPLAAMMLARAGQYRIARLLGMGLYWTEPARTALNRVMAQAALQQADAEAALELTGNADPLVDIQAAALQQDWARVERLYPLVDRALPGSFLADDALIRALLAQGHIREAADALHRADSRFKSEPALQNPVSQRVLQLGAARIAAENGEIARTQQALQPAPAGVPAWELYRILARAAERAHRVEEAASLYSHTFSVAPERARPELAERIQRLGRPAPKVPRRRSARGTVILAASLVVMYLLQTWLNAAGSNVLTLAGFLRPSDATAAFLLNIQGAPSADATWRYLSYAFVHGNLLHIAFNVWVLVDLGRVYEARRNWGSLLAAFTLGSIMGAYITSIAQATEVLVLVGASGGVLGVGGALLADALRSGLNSDRQLTRSLLQWVGMIILFSVFIEGVSLWGHVGGLIGGLLWGFARQGLPRNERIDLFAGGLSIGLLIVAFLAAVRVALPLV